MPFLQATGRGPSGPPLPGPYQQTWLWRFIHPTNTSGLRPTATSFCWRRNWPSLCLQKLGFPEYNILHTMPSELEGLKARHPFIERDSVFILGEHVTLDQGTGCCPYGARPWSGRL